MGMVEEAATAVRMAVVCKAGTEEKEAVPAAAAAPMVMVGLVAVRWQPRGTRCRRAHTALRHGSRCLHPSTKVHRQSHHLC